MGRDPRRTAAALTEGNDEQALSCGRLRQIVAYGAKVYDLRSGLNQIKDSRRKPHAETSAVAAAIFYSGLLRIRSLNALEPKLSEKPFLHLLGMAPELTSLCSADTVSRALKRMDRQTVQALSVGIVSQAERNKVFREGWYGALRYVALDGWEPICSVKRHCDECLVRCIKVKQRGGSLKELKQFYHRYAVAMLIDRRFDLALDIEPLLPKHRRGSGEHTEDEGELTAATRLVRRVKQTHGWLDVVVADALYANGPFLTTLQQLRMGAVIIARKETDEPLREALALWGDAPAGQTLEDEQAQERIELWDCPELETLESYSGKIRVVRARVCQLENSTQSPKNWCMLVAGKATNLSAAKVLSVARSRWHIENTAFHQWTTHWYFNHVFVHHAGGILAVFWLFFAAFNLLTLFLYQQLRSYGRDRGSNVTRTISRLIDEMQDELARLDRSAWDTS